MDGISEIKVSLARIEERQINIAERVELLATKESVNAIAVRVADIENDQKYVIRAFITLVIASIGSLAAYIKFHVVGT